MRRLLPAALLLLAATLVSAQSRAPGEDPLVTAARANAQLAIAYLKQNDLTVAKEKIEKALSQNPRDASVQTSAGLLYERLQDVDLADKHYSAALRLEPKNPDMQNNYAVFQCRRGRYAEGQKLFEQAARNPSYATPEVAYANAGVCARSAGNLPRAEELFRKALKLRSDFPDALLQLADLTYTRGAGLLARGFLERYFNVSPATPDALSLGIKIEHALGDEGAVTRYSMQLLRDFPASDQARQLRGGGGGE
jgi:type IV pilus assembly protein PilF